MVEYMNTPKQCIVCHKGPEMVESRIIVNGKPKMIKLALIKHHVSYQPERIAFVHLKCHLAIHEGKYPAFIQYQPEDSKVYYRNKSVTTHV